MLDCSAMMHTGMTFNTKRDQILAAIITGMTTAYFINRFGLMSGTYG